jgi:hypothetical protein
MSFKPEQGIPKPPPIPSRPAVHPASAVARELASEDHYGYGQDEEQRAEHNGDPE